MPNPHTVIKEKETKAAHALAKRKGGATRVELAQRLGCSVDRAKHVFEKAGITPKATRQQGRGRALVYQVMG